MRLCNTDGKTVADGPVVDGPVADGYCVSVSVSVSKRTSPRRAAAAGCGAPRLQSHKISHNIT